VGDVRCKTTWPLLCLCVLRAGLAASPVTASRGDDPHPGVLRCVQDSGVRAVWTMHHSRCQPGEGCKLKACHSVAVEAWGPALTRSTPARENAPRAPVEPARRPHRFHPATVPTEVAQNRLIFWLSHMIFVERVSGVKFLPKLCSVRVGEPHQLQFFEPVLHRESRHPGPQDRRDSIGV